MNRHKQTSTRAAVLFLAGSLGAGGAPVVTAQADPSDVRPGLYPRLTAGIASDDNILTSESDEISDMIVTLAPALAYRTGFGKHVLELGYSGEFASYRDHSDENYDDHVLGGDLRLDLTQKMNLRFGGGYTWAHDQRGAAGSRTALSATPDLWEQARLLGELVYGRRTARGRLALAVDAATLRYTNNEQGLRDRDTRAVTGTFFYHLTGITAALVELGRTEVDYVDAAAIRHDSRETRLLVGAEWEATAQTTGKLRLGRLEKDIDDAAERDFSGLTVIGEIIWEPRPTDQVRLTAIREPRESSRATASYYVATGASVAWSRALTDLLTLHANLAVETDDFTDDRADDVIIGGYGISYDLTDRLDLAGRYTLKSRDSNVAGLDFDVNVLWLTLTYAPPQ